MTEHKSNFIMIPNKMTTSIQENTDNNLDSTSKIKRNKTNIIRNNARKSSSKVLHKKLSGLIKDQLTVFNLSNNNTDNKFIQNRSRIKSFMTPDDINYNKSFDVNSEKSNSYFMPEKTNEMNEKQVLNAKMNFFHKSSQQTINTNNLFERKFNQKSSSSSINNTLHIINHNRTQLFDTYPLNNDIILNSPEHLLNQFSNNLESIIPPNLQRKQSDIPNKNTVMFINNNNNNVNHSQKIELSSEQLIENKRKLLKNFKHVFDSSDEEEEVDEETKEEKHSLQIVFEIDGYFIKFWENLILIIILYTLFITPLTFAFHIFNHTYNHTVDLVFDAIYISDIIIHCFTPFINFQGKLIKSNKHIVEHYVGSWFPTDFISTLHVLEYAPISSGFNNFFKSFSVYLRLLKTVKIIKKFEKIEKILEKINISLYNIKLFEYTLTFFIISHNFACMWIFIAQSDTQNWISNVNLNDASSFDLYIASLYFIWATMFTIGYGDIISVNMYERIFNIIIMIFGIFIFSFNICYLVDLFKVDDENSLKLNKNIKILNEIKSKFPLIDHIVPPEKEVQENKEEYEEKTLYQRINSHLHYDFTKNKQEMVKMVNELPFNYRNTILLEFYQNLMNQFSFFKCFSNLSSNENFISNIILKMKPICLVKNEMIVKEGETLEDLWFIKKGVISVELGQEYLNKGILKLMDNDCFSVMNIINGEKSLVNLRVISNDAELFVIEKRDFIELSLTRSEEMANIIENFRFNSTQLEKLINNVKLNLILKENESKNAEDKTLTQMKNSEANKIKMSQKFVININKDETDNKHVTLGDIPQVKSRRSSKSCTMEATMKNDFYNNFKNITQSLVVPKVYTGENIDNEKEAPNNINESLEKSDLNIKRKYFDEGENSDRNNKQDSILIKTDDTTKINDNVYTSSPKIDNKKIIMKKSKTIVLKEDKEKRNSKMIESNKETNHDKDCFQSLREKKSTNKSFKNQKYSKMNTLNLKQNISNKKSDDNDSWYKRKNKLTEKEVAILMRKDSKFKEMNDIVMKNIQGGISKVKDESTKMCNEFQSIIKLHQGNNGKDNNVLDNILKKLDRVYYKIKANIDLN